MNYLGLVLILFVSVAAFAGRLDCEIEPQVDQNGVISGHCSQDDLIVKLVFRESSEGYRLVHDFSMSCTSQSNGEYVSIPNTEESYNVFPSSDKGEDCTIVGRGSRQLAFVMLSSIIIENDE